MTLSTHFSSLSLSLSSMYNSYQWGWIAPFGEVFLMKNSRFNVALDCESFECDVSSGVIQISNEKLFIAFVNLNPKRLSYHLQFNRVEQ